MPKIIKKNKKAISPPAVLLSRRVKIQVIGLGGGGIAIISEMADVLKGVNFLAVDSDIKSFKRIKKGIKTFQLGEKLLGGMGTGMNADLAQKAALEEKEKIIRQIKDQDLIVFVGALGGGAASGAAPIFAQAAAEQKIITVGIFTLPFSFEGEKKMRLAKKALAVLEEKLSGTIAVPNERIFLLIDKKTPLKKSLSILNKTFAFWLNDLLQVIVRPGLINIDFADLKTILEKRGKKLFFGQGVSQGLLRAEEVVKNIFQSPFVDGVPKNVKRILFNITGGKDLGLKEVETISNNIAALNPKAKIIFGITESPSFQGRVKIILLAVSDDESADASEEGGGVVVVKTKQGGNGGKVAKKGKAGKNSKADKPDRKIRRSAVEVKQAEEEEKDREWEREADWEMPAFLRKKME